MKKVRKRLANIYYDYEDNMVVDFRGDIGDLIGCIYYLKQIAKQDFKTDLGDI